MTFRKAQLALGLCFGTAMMLLAACNPAQPTMPTSGPAKTDSNAEISETQQMAETALGKQAEILAQGDLARNGLEQLLVVNPSEAASGLNGGLDRKSAILITRAAVLEDSGGEWTEVLRCDEHLKNPRGYLGGSPTGRVNGWRLEYNTDTKQGLEMKFTPAEGVTGRQPDATSEPESHSVVVRWNAKAKRYQSLDESHERYLSEAPTLETPRSILR